MPRFVVTRGKNGMAQTGSIRPPGEKAKAVPTKPLRRKITPTTQDGPGAEPQSAAEERALTPKRRRIVREGGEIRIEGGPGPRIASGFSDHIEDPFAGEENDDTAPALDPEDSEENPDADDTSDIDAANEATAAARAAAEGEEGDETEAETVEEAGDGTQGAEAPALARVKKPRTSGTEEPTDERFQCADCDFSAATRAGLSSHRRAHHEG